VLFIDYSSATGAMHKIINPFNQFNIPGQALKRTVSRIPQTPSHQFTQGQTLVREAQFGTLCN
jgi:hypothetical protein